MRPLKVLTKFLVVIVLLFLPISNSYSLCKLIAKENIVSSLSTLKTKTHIFDIRKVHQNKNTSVFLISDNSALDELVAVNFKEKTITFVDQIQLKESFQMDLDEIMDIDFSQINGNLITFKPMKGYSCTTIEKSLLIYFLEDLFSTD